MSARGPVIVPAGGGGDEPEILPAELPTEEPSDLEPLGDPAPVEVEPAQPEAVPPAAPDSGGRKPSNRAAKAGARKAEAKKLKEEALLLYRAKNFRRALKKIKRSVSLHRTADAMSLYGMLACRAKDAKAARRVHKQLSGKTRTDMEGICGGAGIKL